MGLELDRGEDQRDHDVDLDGFPLLLEHRQDSPDDGASLHVGNLRVQHAEAAATGTEHRVLLVQLLDLGEQTTLLVELVRISALILQLLDLEGLLDEVRQEFVERRVEKTDGDGQALHRREDALEVALLHRQDLVDGSLALLRGVRGDHLVHGRQTIGTEEHVLGTTQADALSTQLTSLSCVGGVVGVGLDAEMTDFVGPGEDLLEVGVDLRRDERQARSEDLTGRTVEGDHVALVDDGVTDRQGGGLGIDLDAASTSDTGLAHATGDHGCVGGHATVGSQDALAHDDAVDVIRGGLEADEDDLLALGATLSSDVGVEDGLANGGTRGGREALGDRLLGVVRVDGLVQQLIELCGLDPHEGLFLGDDALGDEVAGHLESSSGSALAVTGLQQVQLAVLDGELHVLHVAVVRLHLLHGVDEVAVCLWQHFLHLGEGARGANARDDVLTLGVDEELTVELLGAGGGVTGETDTGGGGVTTVTEHHLHDVDGGTEVVWNLVGLAVDEGARVEPGTEHGVDGAHQLLARIRRPVTSELLVGQLLEGVDQTLEVISSQIRVGLDALFLLESGQGILVDVGVDALDDLAVHLDEAAVAVPGEALVAGLLGDGLDGVVGNTEVEDGVHHAGHRDDGAGANRDQEGLVDVAQATTGALLQTLESVPHLRVEALRPLSLPRHGVHAGFSGDGESVGHRDAETRHLGNSCALAAEQRLHLRAALGQVIHVTVSHD